MMSHGCVGAVANERRPLRAQNRFIFSLPIFTVRQKTTKREWIELLNFNEKTSKNPILTPEKNFQRKNSKKFFLKIQIWTKMEKAKFGWNRILYHTLALLLSWNSEMLPGNNFITTFILGWLFWKNSGTFLWSICGQFWKKFISLSFKLGSAI